ncbi:MAG: DUF748 domain-containing protein [Candidatus Loosdrechtia sp.]|uniref:DUF748 domain-containing protein n=1 Tax=Candidatus Loosdrechtia sp. TaxID=3101272 RepID=UPI003A659E42|nr:MAG: AsmA family protein [Candidatus Jettenia sp. AMX2]
MKKAILITISVILFLIGAAVVAPFVVDLNKHKDRIINLVKPYLGRDFYFDDIKLTVMSGLGMELHRLRIKENPEFGEGDFLEAERLRVRVKLLPLLKKQIQVSEFVLNEPYVQIIRNSKGEFNYYDIAGFAEDGDSVKETGKEEEVPGGILAAAFIVSKLSVHNGTIHFIDEYVPGGPVVSKIELFDLGLADVSPEKPVRLFLTAQLPGMTDRNFGIKGTIGPVGKSLDINSLFMDINLSFRDLSIGKLRHYMPAGMPVVAEDGVVRLDIHARGDLATGITSEGIVQCTGLTLVEVGESKKTENIHISLKKKINIKWEEGNVSFEQFDLAVNESTVSINGNIAGINNTAKVDLEIRSHIKKSDKIVDIVSPFIGVPSHMEPEGDVFIRGSVKGEYDDISVDLGLSSSRIAFWLYQKPEQHNGEDFSKDFMESVNVEFLARKEGDKITGDGILTAEKGVVQFVPFKMLQTDFVYTDGLLTIKEFQTKAFEGNIVMSGTVDTGKMQWHAEPVIQDVSAGEMVDTLTQYAGIFKGLFSGEFSSDGTFMEDGDVSLNVAGSFHLAQGEIRNINLIDTILESLLGMKDISGFLVNEKGILYQQKTTQFDYLDGDILLTGNILNVKRFELRNIRTAEATDSDVNLDGIVYLDKGTLDLKGEVVLSPKHSMKLTDKAKQLKALLNQEGRLILPVTITGTINKPKPILNTRYVLDVMMKHYAGREIEKGLEKLGLSRKEDEKESKTDEEKEKPLERLLDKFLKDIPSGK